MGEGLEFTDEEHRLHCEIAGCVHPAVHPSGSQGWCALCREVAFQVPVAQWTDLRARAAQFGWLIACTREPDGSYSWEVSDAARGERMQAGFSDTWDNARLDMIENLHPPSDEGSPE